MSYGFKVIIEGDFACFTRPEFKVERVSYDVPPPGAIEGLLKSVYWKPAIRYVIDRIIVFNPINFINIRRNEVKEKVKYTAIKKQMNGKGGTPCIYTTNCRTQKSSMVLKNVKYGVEFHFEMTGIQSDQEDECEEKHFNIIKRRLENGQFFRAPCLGCSEFPVHKIELIEEFDLDQVSQEIIKMGDVDLGYMSYKVSFKDKGVPKNNDWSNPVFSDCATTLYFRPHMVKGVIDVDKYRREMKC